MIDMDQQNLDPNTRLSKFPLRFLQGTKKSPVCIRFGMQIQVSGAPHPVTVESNSSLSLVVITNESQWEDSAGTLLKKEVFSEGQVIRSFETISKINNIFLKNKVGSTLESFGKYFTTSFLKSNKTRNRSS